MSRWIDETALRLAGAGDTAMTRGRLLRVAGAGLAALTGLGALPRLAAADDYCLWACNRNADNLLGSTKDALKAEVLKKFGDEGSLPALSYVARSLAYAYGQYYEDRGRCKLAQCGDASKYPPPQPTSKSKCKEPNGCTCGTLSTPLGAYCGTCPGNSNGGYIPCALPDKEDKSPCCP